MRYPIWLGLILLLWATGEKASAQLLELKAGFAFENIGFFGMPSALAYDDIRHRLAVADRGRGLIFVFDLNNQAQTVLGERHDIGEPLSLAFGKDGSLFVAVARSSLILKFPFESDIADTIYLAQINMSKDVHPKRLYIGPSGILYIIDSDRPLIHMVDRTGEPLGKITGRLRRPNGIIENQSGQLLVADRGLDPILVYSPDGTFLKELSRPEALTSRTAVSTAGLALDRRGWIYTLDVTNNKLLWLDPTGVNRDEWAPETPPFFPIDLAIDRYENIYILESGGGRVMVFSREH